MRQLRAARPAATLLVQAVFPRGSDEGVPKTRGFRRAGWWDAARNNHFGSIGHVNRGVRSLASAQGLRVRMRDEGLGTLALTPSPNPHLDCTHPHPQP